MVERAWNWLKNCNWCELTLKSDGEIMNILSQRITPGVEMVIKQDESLALKIHLYFNNKLKNFKKGYVFKSKS